MDPLAGCTDTAVYSLSDGKGIFITSATLTFFIAANSPPLASAISQFATVNQEVLLDFKTFNLDQEGDDFAVVRTGTPTYGQVNINGTRIWYKADPKLVDPQTGAEDFFGYTIEDALGRRSKQMMQVQLLAAYPTGSKPVNPFHSGW
eukprot:gene6518-6746_t